ncbi:MAG: hypothetical protein GX542_04465 [Rhodococcus sp.]|nr:hypothetical protein [Rhodococcus sp. (in: high G+C Gram-positive bacteria)]
MLVASCSSSDSDGAGSESATAAATAESVTPRLGLTYDGGILVLDQQTLEVVDTVDADGFLRLNAAGDGRHFFVSTPSGFSLFDAGTWTEDGKHYTAAPAFTDITFDAEKPGHVVVHGGKTVLWDDGNGEIRSFDTKDVANDPAISEYTTTAHHGVAVELENGDLVLSVGDENARTGAQALDKDRNEIARSEECPALHGEATGEGEVVGFGCQDGVLIYRDGAFTKAVSPDAYGRVGTLAGDDSSPFFLGDYKSDPEAEKERPTRVAIIDSRSGEVALVELGASYSSKSLARGPHGEALVLGTDGKLHVIDPETKQITSSIEVVAPWTEPDNWQEPRPTIFVSDHTAFITEPSTNKIYAVDIEGGKVTATGELPQTPNEIKGVTGDSK